MNGRRSKELRRRALTLRQYKAMKRAHTRGGSQNPKPLADSTRKAKPLIKATWPRTPDQKGQSRPVIVLKPVRAMLDNPHLHPKTARRIRSAGNWMPKHMLDAGVVA